MRSLTAAIAKAQAAHARLVDFEVVEVSLVDRGANRHVFAIVKGAERHLVRKVAGGAHVVPVEIVARLIAQGGL